MKVIKLITAKTEFELVDKLNKEEFFATQPIQKLDGSWICFCYSNLLENEKPTEQTKTKESATKKQLYYLKSNKIKIPFNLTKQEAFKIISEHKK